MDQLHQPSTFEARLKEEASSYSDLDFGDVVTIKKDGTLIFRGLVEARRVTGPKPALLTLSGRDYSAKLSYRLFGSTLSGLTEPADVIEALLRETVEVNTYKDDFDDDVLNFDVNRGTWVEGYGLVEGLDTSANKMMLAYTKESASAWTNYTVSAYVCPLSKWDGNRLNWSDVACGVIGGHILSGSDHHCTVAHLNYDGTNKEIILAKYDNSAYTEIAAANFSWDYLQTQLIQLQLRGTTARVYVNGEMLVSGTIPAGWNTGNAGMIAGGSHCQFDSFFVSLQGTTATASANSATAIDALDGALATKWPPGTTQSNGQWFKLDLGAISTMETYPGGAVLTSLNDTAHLQC